MADKKISALTSASTPLAGTEVLPIVQSGATVKVAVSDLTSGRAVGTAALTATGLITAPKGSSAGITIGDVTTNSNSVLRMQGTSAGYNWQIANNLNSGGIEFTQSTATGGTTYSTPKFEMLNTGNFNVAAGNVIIGTAAKGINYTANTPQAGMTSQLLNWYEEGTFSPLVSGTTGGSATYFENSGMYTRMGNIVYFRLRINCASVTSMTGNAQITGLPFTCKSGGGRNIVNPDAPQNLTGYLTNTSIGGTYISGSVILLADNLSSAISAAAYTNTFGIDITGVYNV
jgi:hypothetical protein